MYRNPVWRVAATAARVATGTSMLVRSAQWVLARLQVVEAREPRCCPTAAKTATTTVTAVIRMMRTLTSMPCDDPAARASLCSDVTLCPRSPSSACDTGRSIRTKCSASAQADIRTRGTASTNSRPRSRCETRERHAPAAGKVPGTCLCCNRGTHELPGGTSEHGDAPKTRKRAERESSTSDTSASATESEDSDSDGWIVAIRCLSQVLAR